jgi:hypothetical protein
MRIIVELGLSERERYIDSTEDSEKGRLTIEDI